MDGAFEDDPGTLSDTDRAGLAPGDALSDPEDNDEDLVMDGSRNKLWLAKVCPLSARPRALC
jgi:hypothetical protein